MSLRLSEPGIERGRTVSLDVDGRSITAHEGESVAAALLAAGIRELRRSAKRDQPRGAFCGMGVCFDCVAVIDGRPGVRTCIEPVRDGMHVEVRRAGT